jgi:hypothetical protein
MTGLDSLAFAAYRFHIGEVERLKARVSVLCAIVNARPDCDDIFCRMPIVSGELTGHITLEGYQTLERFFSEELGEVSL